MMDTTHSHSDSDRDPYRGVVIVFLAMALLGTAGAAAGGLMLANRVLLDAAVALGLSTGVLVGVAAAQAARGRPPQSDTGSAIAYKGVAGVF